MWPQKHWNYVDIENILTFRRLAGSYLKNAKGFGKVKGFAFLKPFAYFLSLAKLRVCASLLIYFLYLHNAKIFATLK